MNLSKIHKQSNYEFYETIHLMFVGETFPPHFFVREICIPYYPICTFFLFDDNSPTITALTASESPKTQTRLIATFSSVGFTTQTLFAKQIETALQSVQSAPPVRRQHMG